MELFNTQKCDVPYVPTYDFNFVDDCTVLPAPPPIFDCPLIDIPFETPIPDFNLDIPCPILDVVTASDISFHDNSCDDPTFDVATTLTPSKSGNSCRLDLNLDLDIKIPQPKVRCPTIDATGNLSLITGHAARTATPVFDVVLTNTTTDTACNPNRNCKYSMDLDLRIPILPLDCPVLTTATSQADVNVRTYDPVYLLQSTPLASNSIRASTVDVLITPYDAGTSSRPLCGVALDFMFDLAIPVPNITPYIPPFFNTAASSLIGYMAYSGSSLSLLSMVRYAGPNYAYDPCCNNCDTPVVVRFASYDNMDYPICVVAEGPLSSPISPYMSSGYRIWYMGIACARVYGPVSINDKLKPDPSHRGVRDSSGQSNVTALGYVPADQELIIPVLLGGAPQSGCPKKYQLFVFHGPVSGSFVLPIYAGELASDGTRGTPTLMNATIQYNSSTTQTKNAIEAHPYLDPGDVIVTGSFGLTGSPQTIIMPKGTYIGNGAGDIATTNLVGNGFDAPRVYLSECCT